MSRFLFICSVLLAIFMTAYAPHTGANHAATLRRCGMTCAKFWCFDFLRFPTPEHYRYCLQRCRIYCYTFLYGTYPNNQGWGNPNWPNTNNPGYNPNNPGWNPSWGTNPGSGGSSGGYAWWNSGQGQGGNPLGWSAENGTKPGGQDGGAKPTNLPVNPQQLFNSLDTDADNHLSFEEIKMVFIAENLADIFREADKDENGLLSFNEFAAANFHRLERN